MNIVNLKNDDYILHTIRKVKFLSKNSILTKLYNFLEKSKLSTTKKCKTTTFWRFFSTNFFWQFFSWNQSCQQLKTPKPQHFHDFFIQKFFDDFLGKSKLNFWSKLWDFEQCDFWIITEITEYFEAVSHEWYWYNSNVDPTGNSSNGIGWFLSKGSTNPISCVIFKTRIFSWPWLIIALWGVYLANVAGWPNKLCC